MTETRAKYLIGPAPHRQTSNGGPLPAAADAGFPGCETVPMNAKQFARCDRHIEYWDARRGVAWMVREASIEHERPLSRLVVLTFGIGKRPRARRCRAGKPPRSTWR